MSQGSQRVQWISFLLQGVAWMAFSIAPLLLDWNILHDKLLDYSLQQLILFAFYCTNYFGLIPKLLYDKGVLAYIIGVTLAFLLLFPLFNLLQYLFVLDHRQSFHFSWRITIVSIQVYAVSTTFRMVTDRVAENETRKELMKQKTFAELAFLRSQINPHFLFNTLNNITALVRLSPEKAEDAIAKLSAIMRYMLNAGKHGKVILSEELNYLHNYIELQRLRIDPELKFNYKVQGDPSGLKIEPLCLIGFIENAFKHGSTQEETDFIDIEIRLVNHLLALTVSNSKPKIVGTGKTESGIGLENIRKRLDLLYPEKYTLKVNDTKEQYTVDLTLELS